MGREEEELRPGAAYAAQVYEWLKQAHQAQVIQMGFYTFLAEQARTNSPFTSSPSFSQSQTFLNNQSQQRTGPPFNQPEQRTINNNTIFNNTVPQIEQRIYTVPSLWKRIVAELLDIFILFTLKIIITFTAVDFFEILELEGIDVLNLPNDNINIETLDYNVALQFTTELLLLELVHRFVVCIFEAMCTHRGQRGTIGGATPGKVMMGLKIVKCDQVIPLGGMRVLVTPGNNLGIGWALLRSFFKNVSLAVFFPLCISLMFLPNNSRTLHDVISRSIVVENEQRENRQQH